MFSQIHQISIFFSLQNQLPPGSKTRLLNYSFRYRQLVFSLEPINKINNLVSQYVSDKHKSYHIKDEQLSRDGFKKFMKNESCPFEQCRFSRVCNHIHCIRPHCSYVLHSSGQLFSHKRKHERHESELAYRKYKQVGAGCARPTWPPEDLGAQGLSLSLNGESSNEGRGSPSYYSMEDSFQSASDLAMDLTASATTIGSLAGGSSTMTMDHNVNKLALFTKNQFSLSARTASPVVYKHKSKLKLSKTLVIQDMFLFSQNRLRSLLSS